MQNRNFTRLANKTAVPICLLAVTVFLAGSWQAGAQASSTAQGSRGFAPFGALVRLAGHTLPQVQEGTAIRLGHYNPDQKLRLVLALQRPHPVEEEQFLAELQDPDSPNFRQFLSPEEWTTRFGPSIEDEQSVVNWAVSQGLTVTNRFSNRLLVDLEASAGLIEKVFGVTLNNYELDDEVDFANDRDPQIPAQLSGIVSGVFGLNSIVRARRIGSSTRKYKGPDYVPGPVHSEAASSQGDGDPSRNPANQASPMASALSSSKPDIMNGWMMEPSDIQSSQAYNYKALYALGHCCNPHNDSSGSPPDSSIVIDSLGGFTGSDVVSFFKHYGMAWNYTVYAIDGSNAPPGPKCTTDCTLNGDDGEGPLDLDYATAMANSYGPSKNTAHVYVYEAVTGNCATLPDMYNFMISDGHAKVLTTSYGWAEGTMGCGNQEATLHGIFNEMTGDGWTLVAAAGDDGSTDICDSKADTATVSVDFPGSDPNFVSVGGTRLDLNSSGIYQSEIAWNSSGSPGCWGAGGGGVSQVYNQPSWQNGLSYLESTGGKQKVVSGSTMRLVPDISLNAASGQTGYDKGGWDSEYGTSIGAPELAGFFAQENAYLASIGSICGANGDSACEPIGNANPLIYREATKKPAAHYPFYDITQGCNYSGTGLGLGLTEYCADSGYDTATGWGTINMLQLAWAINTMVIPANGKPYVTFSGPATNAWYNTDQTVNWVIHDTTGSASTPGAGIAGFTQGWDSIENDATSKATPGSGDSFYDGPEFPNTAKGWLSTGGPNGSGQGCHSVHVRGWSNQGYTTGAQSSYPEVYGPICYDTVPPNIDGAFSTTINASGWFNMPASFTLTATDPGGSNASGVAAIYYTVSNSSCTTANKSACSLYTSEVTVSNQGKYSLYGFAEDKAGNYSEPVVGSFGIDTTPPTTNTGLSGTILSGFYQTAVTVTLTATDNLSGVQATYYSLDSGAKVTYSKPFMIATVGNHTLKVWSVDNAGNSERPSTYGFAVQSPTTTTLVASASPAVNAQNVVLTATVTPVAGITSAPTGTVTFLDGGIPIGTGALSGGVATLTIAFNSAGKHVLTASYPGVANQFTSSTSDSVTEVVNISTSTALVASPSPGTFGQLVTMTATVTPSIQGTPTGTVQFMNGTVQISTAKLNGSGVASIASGLPGGSNSLTAIYSGDSTYLGSTSAKVTESVNPATTSTTLSSTANPASYGQAVTYTATVTSTAGIPTGTINFLANGVNVGTGSLTGGIATLGIPAQTLGTQSITATYLGNTNFAGSTSQVFPEVINVSATTTKVATTLAQSEFGQSVTIETVVVPAFSGKPTGTIEFLVNGKKLGTRTLDGATASFITEALPVGTNTITASYGGDTNYESSVSKGVTEVTLKAPSATKMASSENPSTAGQSVTFTATVKSETNGTPEGTVTFKDADVTLATGRLTDGTASYTTTTLAVGTHSITAVYAGSADFKTSTSKALTQTVDAANGTSK